MGSQDHGREEIQRMSIMGNQEIKGGNTRNKRADNSSDKDKAEGKRICQESKKMKKRVKASLKWPQLNK